MILCRTRTEFYFQSAAVAVWPPSAVLLLCLKQNGTRGTRSRMMTAWWYSMPHRATSLLHTRLCEGWLMHNAFVEAFVSAVCCGRRRSTLEPEALRAADERWNNCGNRASTPPAAYHRYANEGKLSTKTPKMSLMFELSLGFFFASFVL